MLNKQELIDRYNKLSIEYETFYNEFNDKVKAFADSEYPVINLPRIETVKGTLLCEILGKYEHEYYNAIFDIEVENKDEYELRSVEDIVNDLEAQAENAEDTAFNAILTRARMLIPPIKIPYSEGGGFKEPQILDIVTNSKIQLSGCTDYNNDWSNDTKKKLTALNKLIQIIFEEADPVNVRANDCLEVVIGERIEQLPIKELKATRGYKNGRIDIWFEHEFYALTFAKVLIEGD